MRSDDLKIDAIKREHLNVPLNTPLECTQIMALWSRHLKFGDTTTAKNFVEQTNREEEMDTKNLLNWIPIEIRTESGAKNPKMIAYQVYNNLISFLSSSPHHTTDATSVGCGTAKEPLLMGFAFRSFKQHQNTFLTCRLCFSDNTPSYKPSCSLPLGLNCTSDPG